MHLKYKAHQPNGRLHSATLEDEKGRAFRWSYRFGITQWIDHPVCNEHGVGDGYWRRAGKRDAVAVDTFLLNLKLIETRAEMNARVAKEAIGF